MEFTITASNPPSADLTLNLQITAKGTSLDETAAITVTLTAGQTATWLTLETAGGPVDLTGATVTLSIQSGAGYTIGSPSTASAYVEDRLLPTPTPTPQIRGQQFGGRAPAPSGVSASGVSRTSIRVSWTSDPFAAAYRVQRWNDDLPFLQYWDPIASGITSASYTAGGLRCGRSYSFRVSARGDGAFYTLPYGPWSSSASGSTYACPTPTPRPPAPTPTPKPAPAPSIQISSTSQNSITVSWSADTGVEYFALEYPGGSVTDVTYTSRTFSNLICNTTYAFRVRGRGDGSPYSTSYGDWSSSVSASTGECPTASAPSIQISSTSQNSITVSWSADTGVEYFALEYPGGSVTDVRYTSRTFNLTCNTTYSFRVRGRGDGSPFNTKYSDWSSSVSASTGECPTASAPSIQISSTSQNSITVSWSADTGVEYYALEYPGGSVTDVRYTSRTFNLTCSNTTHIFRVRGRGDGSPFNTKYSSAGETTGEIPCPTAPTPSLKVSATAQTSITLSWDARDGVSYELVYSSDGGSTWHPSGNAIAGRDGEVSEEVALACGTAYTFRARGRGTGSPYNTAYSAWSSSESGRTTGCDPPQPTMNDIGATTRTSITVSWALPDDSAPVASYKLERSADNDMDTWPQPNDANFPDYDEHVIAGITETMKVVEGLDCGITYYFRVSAKGGDSTSYADTHGPVSDPPTAGTTSACAKVAPQPTGLTATPTAQDKITVSWVTQTGVTAYKLEHAVAGTPTPTWTAKENIAPTPGMNARTSQIVDNLKCSTTYHFRVSGKGDGSDYITDYGTPSDPPATSSIPCPAPTPANFMVDDSATTQTSITLQWDTDGNVAFYKLERKDGSGWAIVATATPAPPSAAASDVAAHKLPGAEPDVRHGPHLPRQRQG